MTVSLEVDRVKRFYDENTSLFLSLGQGTEGTIHRAVWGPGVESRVHAMAYVDGLILERLRRLASGAAEVPCVADLGCGVCASLCRMATVLPLQAIGLTISDEQVALSRRRIEAQGLAGSVECVKGDFCALPSGLGRVALGRVDLAFSIEAFVHAPSGDDYFRECARLIRPGGTLIVCDDFITRDRFKRGHRASRWLDRFRRGWVAENLDTEDEARERAKRAGFSHVETIDLTPYLEIRRPRDYAIGALMRAFGWLPIENNYWLMLYGGHAAQICLKRGWLKHAFVVWRRDEPRATDAS
jgi:SAM-dependent methyltransferase